MASGGSHSSPGFQTHKIVPAARQSGLPTPTTSAQISHSPHFPIRVAAIMGRMMGGGVESTVMNHYRHIDRSRVQFDFIVDSDSTVVPREEIQDLGGRIFEVPPYQQLASYIRACQSLFERIHPSIVHSHLNALSVFPLCAAKLAGVPIRIAHSHSTSNPEEHLRHLAKNALRPFSRSYPTHYAACSEFAARWLFGDRLVDTGQVFLMRNAIDIDAFTFNTAARTAKRAELGVSPDQLLVGQVGRLSSQKNQLFTERVFAQILRTHPDALLVFVGDGPLHDDVRGLARDLGIERQVRFLGVRDDVPELYQACDMLAFPSLYEGLGMAAIEAQTAGLPVVASTQVPSEACLVPELIDRRSLGEGVASWADALIKSAERQIPRRLADSGHAVERVAASGYEIAASAERLCAWYESLIGAQPAQPARSVELFDTKKVG